MKRTITYHINNLNHKETITSFLSQQGFSSQNLKELKKMPESVLKNGTWAYLKEELTNNDTLVIHINEEEKSEKIPAIDLPLDIIYEDEDILILNKAADMPIHPSLNNYENSLANGLAYYYQAQGKPFIFRCINRLDRDTTGLTIIAKHMVSASILSSQVVKREIHREYLAISKGSVTPIEGTIDAPIGRCDNSLIKRRIDFEHGERAVTHYKVIDYKNGHSLLSIHLETGRTHQIRVHLKYLGFPLIGDYLYHPDKELIQRQALHSHKLIFTHPITKEEMTFVAPLPCDMALVLHNQT